MAAEGTDEAATGPGPTDEARVSVSTERGVASLATVHRVVPFHHLAVIIRPG